MFVKLRTFAKYLDQPALVDKMNKKMPYFLTAVSGGYLLYDTFNSPKEKRKKQFVQTASVLAFTVSSALIATTGKIGKLRLFEGLIEPCHLHLDYLNMLLRKKPIANTMSLVSKAKSKVASVAVERASTQIVSKPNAGASLKLSLDEDTKILLQKVKDNEVLNFNEIEKLEAGLKKTFKKDGLINKVIPNAHTHGPFAELSKLSLLGLIPVVGGIVGGVVGDLLTGEKWKEKLPNKVKEGSYQYLNNIFLCNVGAGLAMVAMNKLGVKSTSARFVAMLGGVIGVGLLAGSTIANYIGKKIINPIFGQKDTIGHFNQACGFKANMKELNSERRPEMIDLSLHVDDIASVGFLSGMKWIGPVLPALYSVSGYRAGIGYRNGNESK